MAAIVGAGALVYANALPGMLFWDNEVLILKNVFLRSFRFLPQIFTTSVMAGGGEITNYYRPIPVALLLVQFQLWGTAPAGYHAVNILLHLANAALLFSLAERLLKDRKAAFLASLLFALHPVNNETVNYIDHIEGMLALLFGLAALLAEDDGRRKTSLACWTLCLLSKEEGLVFLPLLALWKPWRSLRAHAAIAALYLAAHLTVFNFLRLPILSFGAQRGAYGGVLLRLLTFAKALRVYFRLLAWPTGLHFDRDLNPAGSLLDPAAWACALADATVLALLWRLAKTSSSRLGLLWFCVALLPYCGLAPFNNLLAEHFLYIPAIGLFMTLADLVRPILARWPRPAAGAIAGLLALYAFQDARRNRDWQDPVRIYETTLAGNPRSYRAANNLGVESFRAGRLEEARRRFEAALAARPDYAPALNNVGAVEEAEGHRSTALSWYQRSAEADPSYSVAWKNQAGIFLDQGRYADAEKAARKALEIYPQYPEALRILAALQSSAEIYHNLR